MSSPLKFCRWRIEGFREPRPGAVSHRTGARPARGVEGAPEPEPVDPAVFWNSSASRRAAGSFRYALRPAVFRARPCRSCARAPAVPDPVRDARAEDFAVHRFDTKTTRFINEWWTCRLALNVKEGVAIAIYETSMD